MPRLAEDCVADALDGLVRFVVYASSGYAVLTFLILLATQSSAPKPSASATPFTWRFFSCVWLVFYATAFAILYSTSAARRALRERASDRTGR